MAAQSELALRAEQAENQLARLKGKFEEISKIMNATVEDEKSSGKAEKDQEIHLYYWDLKNRGNFARFVLAEAGVKYHDVTDGAQISVKCKCKDSMPKSDTRFDAFAPPFVHHGDRVISQTSAVTMYLGEVTGLRPKSNVDNVEGLMLLENIFDTALEFGKAGASVDGLTTFLNGRFQHFLDILEKPLVHGDSAQDFYFDNRVTYADLSLANLFDGFHEVLPKRVFEEFIGSKHKALEALYQRIIIRKGVKALLDKQNEAKKLWYPASFFGGLIKNLPEVEKALK